MASVYGSSGGGGGGRQRRSAAAAVEDELQQLQLQHNYMEDPDLDVSSIVTEFVPLEDPFVPYFDAPGEEMESELCAPLEASFASSIGEERMYARFRPLPAGFPPNTSTPRFSDSPRVEVPRGAASSPQRLEDALAELMDGPAVVRPIGGGGGANNRSPLQLVEAPSPSARLYREPPPQLSILDQFLHSISRLVNDAAYARTTNCFRSKIPREMTEDALISFLTHCIRYPMRRPLNMLLQARSSPLVVEQLLKTAMDAQSEPYDATATRDSYFRITLKNSVHSLAQLHQMVRAVSLTQRGYVDVTYSPVRGRIAFIGFNGNLPIRMSQPIGAFVEAEKEARQHLNALFSAEITLSRCGDDAREVYITYFDNIETNPRTGEQSRITEVNVYHIIHPASSSSTMMMTSSPSMTTPLPSMATPPPPLPSLAHGRVSFNPAPPKHHEVHVDRPMIALSQMMEPTFTLAECFQLARSYPQHKW